jgi:hypothetical protein
VNRYAADLTPLQVYFPNVDAATQRDTKRCGLLGDGGSAADRARRAGENAYKPVAAASDFPAAKPLHLGACCILMPIQQNTPIPIPLLSHPLCRVDDIGD